MKNFYRDGGLIISVCALVVMSVLLAASVYVHFSAFFWIILPFLVLTVGFTLSKLFVVTNKTYQYFAYIADRSEYVRGVSLAGLPICICIVDTEHRIVWFNDEFADEFKFAAVYGNPLEVISNIDIGYLIGGAESRRTSQVKHEGRHYVTGALIPHETDATDIFIIYFRNITKETELEREFKLSRPIVILILIDSYDETV